MEFNELAQMVADEKQKKKLTKKQKKWLRYYIETGSATQAAMKAYHTKNKTNASTMGSYLLKNLKVDELLEEAGVTDAVLTDKLKDGLSAISVTKTGGSVPDYGTRHKYLETALKLKGKLNNKVELSGENGQPIRFNILAGHGFMPTVKKNEPEIIPKDNGISK